jgi:1,2-phenylacetyl-CoA epoxidase catalytic subunit
MAPPFGSETRALSDDERARLAHLLEGQGFRELAAAYLFTGALPLAPTLDDKMLLAEQVSEELAHFEAASHVYAEAGFGDLLGAVRERSQALPAPTSWPEVVLAQFLFDRAGYVQLREHAAASYAPYADMVRKIMEEEEHHQAACEAALRELHASHPDGLAPYQPHVETWLRLTLASFDRPATFVEGRALSSLGGRDSATVLADYLASVAADLRAVGLALPSRDALALDLPEGLPLV